MGPFADGAPGNRRVIRVERRHAAFKAMDVDLMPASKEHLGFSTIKQRLQTHRALDAPRVRDRLGRALVPFLKAKVAGRAMDVIVRGPHPADPTIVAMVNRLVGPQVARRTERFRERDLALGACRRGRLGCPALVAFYRWHTKAVERFVARGRLVVAKAAPEVRVAARGKGLALALVVCARVGGWRCLRVGARALLVFTQQPIVSLPVQFLYPSLFLLRG